MKSTIEWLFPPARRKVLALLLLGPQSRWHLRDVARKTGLALGTVRRELKGLAQAQILTEIRDGNRTYYQPNVECAVVPDLTALMRKTAGLADVLRDALVPLAAHINAAFVYGSQASGKATASSDVDLAVVGGVDEMTLHKAIRCAEERLGCAVNYTLLSRHEFLRRRKEKGGFLSRVLGGAKIAILGDIDEI
jgi:DNA-binding transcriptional ArsR family regulator